MVRPVEEVPTAVSPVQVLTLVRLALKGLTRWSWGYPLLDWSFPDWTSFSFFALSAEQSPNVGIDDTGTHLRTLRSAGVP